jgi:hypothetical protein
VLASAVPLCCRQGGGRAAAEDDVTVEGPEEADTLAGVGVNLAAEQEALRELRAGRHTTRTLRDTLPQHKVSTKRGGGRAGLR